MSLDVDYRREYDTLEHAPAEQAVGTRLCSDCQAAKILDPLKPFLSSAEPSHPCSILRFDSTTDLALRSTCPFCRFPWRVSRHISFGGIQFVHPKYADYHRIKTWLETCQEKHEACNEQQSISSRSLHGLSPSCLRLIDVESHLIVQTLHCVPFVTLSYVWGDAASRTFEEKALGSESYHVSDDICPMDRQPIALLEGNLPQTFEDTIGFTKRLGERYI